MKNRAYLFKSPEQVSRSFVIPKRKAPDVLPEPGDTVFLWQDQVGLLGECLVSARVGEVLELMDRISYPRILLATWLDDADRDKQTIRSKINCDRHPRLWLLSKDEMLELDFARRLGWF